jgi:hypothetical protein
MFLCVGVTTTTLAVRNLMSRTPALLDSAQGFLVSQTMPEIPLSRGKVAIVDEADFDALSASGWYCTSHGYAARTVVEKGVKRVVYMHREVARPLESEQVDHINLDSLDNRRANLRCCVGSDNRCNRGSHRNSTTGLKGVQFHRNRKTQYSAVIRKNNRSVFLGYFKTPEEAHAAYAAVSKEHHGEFARNSRN